MATIEGTVSDGESAVEDALVTISDSATDTTEGETRTDASGDYSITVDPDTYDVRAERIGYEADEQTNQNVGTGETKTVDLTLSDLQPKVIGRRSDVAVGVLGESTAGSNTPIGVQASVDSPDGYGLYTPDDAWIEGTIDALSGHTLAVDRNTRFALGSADSDGNGETAGGNVIGGYEGNGVQNDAIGATVGGGGSSGTSSPTQVGERKNTNGVTDDYGTVGGGVNNRAGLNATVGGGKENTASGKSATVPGGEDNVASGNYSFAAGRGAVANNDGSFVWSDSDFTFPFGPTGPDQFLIDAAGGVGIGTNSPTGQRLDVVGDVATSGSFARHVVTITNISGDSTGDILGLRTQVTDPPEQMNFISFTDPNGQVGQIDGNGGGGVNYKSASSDLAEYFPTADPAASFAAGDVVGLDGGELVADPTDAEEALVVSGAPMVTGNAPLDADGDGLACVALLGQVPVRVGAPVAAGDLLVATPDGTAVPAGARDGHAPVVGRALEAGEADGNVETFVTARTGDDEAARIGTLERRLSEKDDRIHELETENEALRERVAAIEAQFGLDGTSGQPTPGDD